MELNKVTEDVLKVIDSYGFKQEGAYNLRLNGMAVCHGDSRHIKIVPKEDKPGIDIHISGETKEEQVHIPVVMSQEGVDIVYNDFYIEDGADVTIVAGCGIHGEGCSETRHDGIHTFHVGKNANVKYVENHYAEGNGTGSKVLNPVTKIYVGENSVFTLETTQIRGVDSTERENYIEAVAEKYHIGLESLRRLVGSTAAATGLARPVERPKSGIHSKATPEENDKRTQRLLLTWLVEEPQVYPKIARFLSPQDFTEELYRRVADKLFEGLEKGEVNAAAIISLFPEEEEQRQVASLFNTKLVEMESQKEKEKAFHDILLSVKRISYEYNSAHLGSDVEALGRVIEGKKALEELSKTHISLD